MVSASPREPKDIEKAEGIAEPVPPEMNAGHREYDGIYLMNVRTDQRHRRASLLDVDRAWSLTFPIALRPTDILVIQTR
jgi:hypothetical protein